jgi:hypothetical protein
MNYLRLFVAFVAAAILGLSIGLWGQAEIARFSKVVVTSTDPDALTVGGVPVNGGGAPICGPNQFVQSSTTCSKTLLAANPTTTTPLLTVGYTNNPALFQVYSDANPNDDGIRVFGGVYFGGSTGKQLAVESPGNDIGGFFSITQNNEIMNDLTRPTLTSGFGAGAALQAHATGSLGRVTLGSAPGATLVLDTQLGSAAQGPVCLIQNETTATLLGHTQSTGTITITGTFTAGDVITWMCWDMRGP